MPVRVDFPASLNSECAERTRLSDLSPTGARLSVIRPTEPGRALRLAFNLPEEMCHHINRQADSSYAVWSVVRHIRLRAPDGVSPEKFEIGVAFTGIEKPPALDSDTSALYDLTKRNETTGFWQCVRRERRLAEAALDFKTMDEQSPRACVRYCLYDMSGLMGDARVAELECLEGQQNGNGNSSAHSAEVAEHLAFLKWRLSALTVRASSLSGLPANLESRFLRLTSARVETEDILVASIRRVQMVDAHRLRFILRPVAASA